MKPKLLISAALVRLAYLLWKLGLSNLAISTAHRAWKLAGEPRP